MRDLRRRALESNKTVSKKAKSKQVSAAGSRLNSAANSRPTSGHASRQVSDDEDELSDETSWSVNSIDDLASLDGLDGSADALGDELETRMEQMIDRKRSSVAGREDTLRTYIQILTIRFSGDEISSRAEDLVPAILKSIKSESSEKETIFALKALAMTMITTPLETTYEAAQPTVKRAVSDSESISVKTAAIHSLGILAFYGDISEDETMEIMDFLLEVVESDGNTVNAEDSADVVAAALEEWAFLATQMEDLEDATEPAMEAFVEQLESADARVQIAAGECIALLYEKSFTELEDDEEAPPEDQDSDLESDGGSDSPKMIKRYTVYRREDQLRRSLQSLANLSSRRVSKKDRKTLHTNFADILNTVEHPTRGPRYQNAIDEDTGRRYGSRMTVRIHRTGEMRIDRWWKLHRLKALRRVLQGGFLVHYEKNEVVFESLPVMISKK